MFMQIPGDTLDERSGFDWDAANATKIWERHRVTPSEAEEVFSGRVVLQADDPAHSLDEPRYRILGETRAGRGLFIVFTIRREAIRVVSARPMNRKERTLYAEAATEAP